MTVIIFFVLFLYPAAAAQDYLTVKEKKKARLMYIKEKQQLLVKSFTAC